MHETKEAKFNEILKKFEEKRNIEKAKYDEKFRKIQEEFRKVQETQRLFKYLHEPLERRMEEID